MAERPSLSDIPLGEIRDADHLFVGSHDDTCSRCREPIAKDEVPLCLWRNAGEDMYRFCQRCAWDPESDRCKQCGCTEMNPCEEGCGWQKPGLCTNC